MFIAFAIGLFLTMICGLKMIAYMVTTHAAMGNGNSATYLAEVNIGIVLTSVCATVTMVFHHFI